MYYVYLNNDLLGTIPATNRTGSVNVPLSPQVLNNKSNVIRLVTRDHGVKLDNGEFAQVGTISLNMEYFANMPDQFLG